MIRLSPALLLALAACAARDDAGFPSLAHRPIEARSEAIETPPPAPAAPADAALSAELARLLAEARRGETAFAAALPATQRAVSTAEGAAQSSEAWVAAQNQLSALDAARAPTATALATLDSLYIDLANRVTAGGEAGGIAEIHAARAEAEALYGQQIEQLEALKARISP